MCCELFIEIDIAFVLISLRCVIGNITHRNSFVTDDQKIDRRQGGKVTGDIVP